MSAARTDQEVRTDEDAAAVLRMDTVTIRRGHGRGAVTVIRQASLTLRAGEIVGISGPSGAGKSSLLAVMSGELIPAAGTVRVHAARSIGPPRRVRRTVPGSIALVAQDPTATLDPLWSLVRCVTEPLRAAGVPRSRARRRALETLAAVGLEQLGPDRYPHELSVGQAQRVCIARALVARPVLLLADEATSALDVTTAAGVAALLRGIARDGTAVVMVGHDHRLLDAVSDRRLHLAEGLLEPRFDAGD